MEGTPEHMAAQARIYGAMADAGVSLDMFTPFDDSLVFTTTLGSLEDACGVLDRMGIAYDVTRALGKVTLVGAGMHGVPGVMARMAASLADAGVCVLQTADSHTTISVLVAEADVNRAVGALHDGFALGK